MGDQHKLKHALKVTDVIGFAPEQLQMIDQLIHILVNPGNVVVIEYVDYESGQDVKTVNLDASLDDLERIFSDYRHRLNMGELPIPGMPRFSDFKILRAMYAQDFIQNALINAGGFTSKHHADFVKKSDQVIDAWRNSNKGRLCDEVNVLIADDVIQQDSGDEPRSSM